MIKGPMIVVAVVTRTVMIVVVVAVVAIVIVVVSVDALPGSTRPDVHRDHVAAVV